MRLAMRLARHKFSKLSGLGVGLTAMLTAVWLAAGPGFARAVDPDPSVLGLWLSEKKKLLVELYPCDDEVCGRIAWMAKPYWKSGELRRDVHNPDPELRDRAWCGIQTIRGLTPRDDGSLDHGSFYNPKDGGTYSLEVTPGDDGTLEIRGYLGIKLIGKSETWTRPGPGITPGCVSDDES